MKKAIFTLFFWFIVWVAEAATEQVVLQGPQGKLAAILQKPALKPGKKCPMVILMHGFGGQKDGKMFESIAQELERQGIASIRFDFNGHGESEGDFQHMTVPNEIEDALCVYQYVTSLDYVKSVALLGHSQGGVVASMTAGKLGRKIKAVVLMAPAAVLRDDAIRGNTFGKAYDAQNPPEYVELFRNVKLGRDYILSAQTLPIYETACLYKGEVCVIHGLADRIVPYTYGQRYAQGYKHCTLHLLPDENHGFSHNLPEAVRIAVDFLSGKLKK